MNPNDTTTRCPHCGADHVGKETYEFRGTPAYIYKCGTSYFQATPDLDGRSDLCHEREARQKLEAEVARLTQALVSCLHITNVYDGDYLQACDHVQIIVSNALKKIANPEIK